MPRFWFLIQFSSEGNQGFLEKWLILRLGQEMYKIRLGTSLAVQWLRLCASNVGGREFNP